MLVIGGGLAGLWGAIRAREQGQRVLLVEKGFAGASGCSVFAGAVVLCLTPDDDLDTFIAEEAQDADYLLDPEWAEFVVCDNYERLREIVAWGGPIPVVTRMGNSSVAAAKSMGGIPSRGWLSIAPS